MATVTRAGQFSISHYRKDGKWYSHTDSTLYTQAAVKRFWPSVISIVVAGKSIVVDALRFTGDMEYHTAGFITSVIKSPPSTPTLISPSNGKITLKHEIDLVTGESRLLGA